MQRNRLRPKKIEKKTLIKVVLYYVGALSMVLIAVYAALTSMLRSFQRDLTLSAQLQYSRSVAALDDDLIAFGVSANEMYTDSDLEPEIFAEHPFSATQSTKKIALYKAGLNMADDLFICFDPNRRSGLPRNRRSDFGMR